MKLKIFEIALTLALVFAILLSALALEQQESIATKLIRLHVVANSDSEDDQNLKLQVRDRVLETAAALIGAETSLPAAKQILLENISALETAAAEVIREAGFDYPVMIKLETSEFPEKAYDSFTLPAGAYTSLTVSIGDAEGKNWWCVVFPPLCVQAASGVQETAAAAGLTDEEIGFILDSGDYVLKFKSLEIISDIKAVFS